MENIKDKIDRNRLPEHVAVIMDGNGRWAKQRNRQRTFGHESAVTAVRDTVEAAAEIGIKYLTLYTFSKENWNRPKDEVDALMHLLVVTIAEMEHLFFENNIRFQAIGDIDNMPEETRKSLLESIKKTENLTGMTLILALNYSSRWEITEGVRKIAESVKHGAVKPEEIDENLVSSSLTTKDYPDPDLMIRTSGELRISNYLLWQLAYSELYFTDVLWPDFNREELYKALLDYQHRERRFGKTGEQVEKENSSRIK